MFLSFFNSSCEKKISEKELPIENPKIALYQPDNFPSFAKTLYNNYPTKYGVILGKRLFFDVQLSRDNSISCATCHIPKYAYADKNPISIGIDQRKGLRNALPIQNMAFLNVYMWDGAVVDLKEQPIIPILTHEEMDASIVEVINKLSADKTYVQDFKNAYGDERINSDRILASIAQYMYTLMSFNSKYDKVIRNEGEQFTPKEALGYNVFKNKCATCHSGDLFTDESFRNIGFPSNPDWVEEAGRARVTGKLEDRMKFRVPSLRNIEHTAPYGSFGQFATLPDVLDYFDEGVQDAPNLDSEMKKYGTLGIPLTASEKEALIEFMKTLSDESFLK